MHLGDALPVRHRCTTHGVSADAHTRVLDRGEVHHLRQCVDIRAQEVVAPNGVSGRRSLHPAQIVIEVLVGTVGDPAGGVGVGGTTARRVVLETTIARWVVGRRDDDTVGAIGVTGAVVLQNREAHCRGGHEAILGVDEHGDPVARKDFERGGLGGRGEGVGVLADKQWPGDALVRAVIHDGLGSGQDVILVEGTVEAAATMPAGAEAHSLLRLGEVGLGRGVGLQQGGDVREVLRSCGLSSAWMHSVLYLSCAYFGWFLGLVSCVHVLLPQVCSTAADFSHPRVTPVVSIT